MNIHLDFPRMHMLKDELNEIYVSIAIRSFAFSLINIFIPVYLLQLGFGLNQVLIFVMINFGTLGFFCPVAAKMANRFGLKHLILIRTPFSIIFLAGLILVSTDVYFVYLLAVIFGIAESFYWVSINSIFVRYSKKLQRGAQISEMFSLNSIIGIIGPFVGGFIFLILGFHILIIISSFLILASVLPLMATPDTKPSIKFSFRKMVNRGNFKFFIGFIAEGARSMGGLIIWPIFVYVQLQDIVSVGFVGTISSLSIALLTFFIGKFSDKGYRTRLLKLGALLTALTWFVRVYAQTSTDIYILTFLGGVTTIIYLIPFESMVFDVANNKKHRDEFLVFKEVSLGMGRILLLLVLLFVLEKFFVGFYLSGLASLFFFVF